MKRLALLAAVAAALWAGRLLHRTETAPAVPRLLMAEGEAPAGFARARAPRPFVLPRDHGPHFDYETEWWYYTGQLEAATGERFGFQLTVFRRGLSPGPPPEGPGLFTNQVYFAHLALSEVGTGRHRSFERWSRGAAGLAGASGEPFRVAIDGWTIEAASPDGSSVRLGARAEGVALQLALRAVKPLVAHGERGLSAKSGDPGNASYYVGYTRMAAAGTLAVDGRSLAVAGEAWFDHEWSTSALGPEAVGWDWFSLQLDDGRELMYFRIRRRDGGAEPVSGGTLVAPSGAARRLLARDVGLEVLSRWRSPATGADYPARWRLTVASEGLELAVDPLIPDQELRHSFRYWEGAVAVSGTARGARLAGRGYVELTGYAEPMRGIF